MSVPAMYADVAANARSFAAAQADGSGCPPVPANYTCPTCNAACKPPSQCKKPGQNQGRWFITCPNRGPDGQRSCHFVWADEIGNVAKSPKPVAARMPTVMNTWRTSQAQAAVMPPPPPAEVPPQVIELLQEIRQIVGGLKRRIDKVYPEEQQSYGEY